jgi:tetratricopeptide (TPR) repeat protein
MTSSFEALRAFLEGTQAEADARYPSAVLAYERAIAADSTFWFAYWRYAAAQSWMLQPVPPAYTQAYLEHLDELPERARVLIQAMRVTPNAAGVEARRAVAERYPDYIPALYAFGDRIAHVGGYFGYALEEAVPPFERLVEASPTSVTGLEHLASLYLLLGDSAGSRRALDALAANEAGEKLVESYGIDFLAFMQMCHGVLFEGEDWAEYVDDAAAIMGPLDQIPANMLGLYFVGHFCGLPQFTDQISQALLVSTLPRTSQRVVNRARTFLWMARGAWDSAMSSIDACVEEQDGGDCAIDAYRIATIGAFYDALDAEVAAERRDAAAAVAATPADSAEIAWLDGIGAIIRGDLETTRAAGLSLRAIDAPNAQHLEMGLAALEADLTGSRDAALEQLQELVDVTGDSGMQQRYPSFDPMVRMQLSQWHLAAGNAAEASTPLLWAEAWYTGVDVAEVTSGVSSVVYLQRGRVEEARGRTRQAIRFYREFLRRYDSPVERHQHLVEEAEGALARLEGMREVVER